MIIERLVVGPLEVNCYIVADKDTKEAVVFDPGGDVESIIEILDNNHLKVKHIINTHTHFDHVGGNRRLQNATGAPILTHPDEAFALTWAKERAILFSSTSENSEASGYVCEGDTIEVGSIRIRSLDLRGHSMAGLGFLFEGDLDWNGERKWRRVLICGDALFDGSIGRTDFAGGSEESLVKNVRTKIFTLPDDTILLYGHGNPSTVGQEKKVNPYYSPSAEPSK